MVDKRLEEQELKLLKQTLDLLKAQKKEFEDTTEARKKELRQNQNDLILFKSEMKEKLQQSQNDLILFKTEFKLARYHIFALAMLQDPWVMEGLAYETIVTYDPSEGEIALRMFIRYLKVVEKFFSTDPEQVEVHKRYLASNGAPDATSPLPYWQKAINWQQYIIKQRHENFINTAEEYIKRLQPQIDEWVAKHGTGSSSGD